MSSLDVKWLWSICSPVPNLTELTIRNSHRICASFTWFLAKGQRLSRTEGAVWTQGFAENFSEETQLPHLLMLLWSVNNFGDAISNNHGERWMNFSRCLRKFSSSCVRAQLRCHFKFYSETVSVPVLIPVSDWSMNFVPKFKRVLMTCGFD